MGLMSVRLTRLTLLHYEEQTTFMSIYDCNYNIFIYFGLTFEYATLLDRMNNRIMGSKPSWTSMYLVYLSFVPGHVFRVVTGFAMSRFAS
jgi:hypothetical protein